MQRFRLFVDPAPFLVGWTPITKTEDRSWSSSHVSILHHYEKPASRSLVRIRFVNPSYLLTQIVVYSPPGSRDKDGNTFFAIDSGRPQQQLFPAEWFSNLPKGGALLKGIAFRSDSGPSGQVSWTADVTGVEIGVSTTQKTVDSLSPVFAENVGADRTMLTQAGDTTFLINAFSGSGQVSTFSLGFGSNHDGFLYDPAAGNLLVDFKGLRFPFGIDAFITDQNVSVRHKSSDPTGLTGQLSNIGYVVAFAFYPVPEPPGPGMLGMVFGVLRISFAFHSEDGGGVNRPGRSWMGLLTARPTARSCRGRRHRGAVSR